MAKHTTKPRRVTIAPPAADFTLSAGAVYAWVTTPEGKITHPTLTADLPPEPVLHAATPEGRREQSRREAQRAAGLARGTQVRAAAVELRREAARQEAELRKTEPNITSKQAVAHRLGYDPKTLPTRRPKRKGQRPLR